MLIKKTTSAGSWIIVPRPNPLARLRLFCFPYGGAGASTFRAWPAGLPPDVEVCAVQLPGRENRVREEPFTDVARAVRTLAEVLSPLFTIPYAFFGHSLGAFIGFELACELCRQNARGPVHLFVSGQRAPHLPDRFPPLYQLPDRDFVAEIQRRYDAIPQAVLQSADLMRMLLPLLRADFTMNDTYADTDHPPLDCPITCLGGERDPETTREGLAAWKYQTRGTFTLRTFPGGHFFLESARTLLLQTLNDELNRL